jgi:hypothetical protein
MSVEEGSEANDEGFIEGLDYYFEDGLMVLTSRYLLRRGSCCGSGCRQCPYQNKNEELEQEDL